MHSTFDRQQGIEPQSLQDATKNILEECRMVLPGIQSLFGFQLIAVFNQRFDTVLSHSEQIAHLVSLAMTALAVALVMTPAAYHRQVHPGSVSRHLLKSSSWMLTLSMLPLMVALAIDLYLIARIITDSPAASALLTAFVSLVFVALWIVYPRVMRYKRKGTAL